MSRYNDIQYFMRMPFRKGLVRAALDGKAEERVWQRWLVAYQHMTEETFIPYEKFKAEILQPRTIQVNRTDEEIIKDAEDILQLMKRT